MIENSIVYRNFKGKYEYLPLSKAEGAELWDKDGKRYIDFTSAWNVTNLGWNHPEIREAIIQQANKNAQGLLWGSDPVQEEYAAALTGALPKELDACVKETGGTESVEVAIKIARTFTGRKKVIGFQGSYHGQLFASLALGNIPGSPEAVTPLVPEIFPTELPDKHLGQEGFERFSMELEKLLSTEDVAAVVTEPGIITGWGTTRIAYPGFLTKIRELTEKYGTLLIVDEVGTGFSRTGKLFGIGREDITPDMIVFAKAIANGAAAIGTVVGRSKVFERAFSNAVLVSTFGWTPIACAAALKTLQIHQRDKTWEMASQKGAYIVDKLQGFAGDMITDVQGQGMEIGLRFRDETTCATVRERAYADGLHVIVGSGRNMQIMPPLTISQKLLDEGLDILTAHVKN